MIRNLVLAAALLVGLGLGAAALAAERATPTADAALRFDVAFHDTIVAKDPAGLSLGDQFILRDDLLRAGQIVGHNGGVCTVTDVGGELVCVVTWSLPGGTIATQFLNTPDPDKTFAIVGGTGAYAGARGTGELIEHGDETGTVAFDLTR